RWRHQQDLWVGFSGVGTMNITDGGLVENTAADANVEVGAGYKGTVTVDGINSRWINAGNLKVGHNSFGDGVLKITGKGFVQNQIAILGYGAGSKGSVEVTGDGSQWYSASTGVGYDAQGDLKVLAGGRVQAGSHLYIGQFQGSSGKVTVDGPNSALIVSGPAPQNFFIGIAGHGELNITGGGSVQSNSAVIADDFVCNSCSGTVIVSGAGSMWDINGFLEMGTGIGTVRIQNGATVNVHDKTYMTDDDLLLLEGGTLSTDEIVYDGSTDRFIWSSGTLHVGTFDGNLTTP